MMAMLAGCNDWKECLYYLTYASLFYGASSYDAFATEGARLVLDTLAPDRQEGDTGG